MQPPRVRLAALLVVLIAVAVAPAPRALRAQDAGGRPPMGDDEQPPAKDAPKDPRTLSDAEKETRLQEIDKQWEDNRRNQDQIPVRTRRNAVVVAGDLRYQPAARFLKKVFDDDRDVTTCVAALVAIGKSGDFETIQYAVRKSLTIANKQPVFAASLPRMFANVETLEAREWIVSRMEQRNEDVAAWVIEAVGESRTATSLPKLIEKLGDTKDVTIRFEVLRAIGKCGGKDAVTVLLPFLSDAEWRLKMAAIEGLGFAGQPEAIGEVRKLLTREEPAIVVETAVEALVRLGTREAIEPLIDSLRVGRLRARQKARAGLRGLAKSLFGHDKDYQVDANSWGAWWRKVKSGVDLEDPTFTQKETASYFNFPIESDRVLFILDVSGSMQWPDPPRDADIKPGDWRERRIDLAHKELFKALRDLAAQNQGRMPKRKPGDTGDVPEFPSAEGVEPPTLFNVATFAGVVTPWRKEPVLASKENIESAIDWLSKQLPRGGTATFDALAFGLSQPNVDTIYFLSDGVPSLGRFEEREQILAEVRRLNRFKRITIHTIALIIGLSPIESARKYEDPEDMADIMSRIAAQNQGRFVNASKP